MSIDQAKNLARDLLCRPSTSASMTPLEPMGAGAKRRRFSVFRGEDLKAATALTESWMQLAKAQGDAALDRILADADEKMATEDVALVKHALLMFITHDPVGRQLPIPPLAEREPFSVLPSSRTVTAIPPDREAMGAHGQEAALDYFREDTWLNEHHAKWHVVYPAQGVNGALRKRQGELFWYMHQQMLARYDAERVSLGMSRAVPLDDFTQPIAEGYDPEIPPANFWAPRPDNAEWPRLELGPNQFYGPLEHARVRDRLQDAAAAGKLRHPDGTSKPIRDADELSDTVEANIGSVEGSAFAPFSWNGSYHNVGHVLIAAAGDPNADGVMSSTATAVRDPVFYRWHRAVDDVMDTWWQKFPRHDLDQTDARVTFRRSLPGEGTVVHASPDIAVLPASAIPAGTDPAAWAEATFGGAAWNTRPASGVVRTKMGTHQVMGPNGPVSKRHLDHDDFYWLCRVTNPGATDAQVTVRVFIVPEQLASDRRAWIEMDKFVEKIPAGAKRVLLRSSRLSSVVRKPAVHPGEPAPAGAPPGQDPNYCDCGWPYNLLLPRGSVAGTAFRLLVLLTDWTKDEVRDEKKHRCGSLSFCGAKDIDYPDKQEMGFPFNRPIDLDALYGRSNVATVAFTIRHQP